jgi:hypothetical protein
MKNIGILLFIPIIFLIAYMVINKYYNNNVEKFYDNTSNISVATNTSNITPIYITSNIYISSNIYFKSQHHEEEDEDEYNDRNDFKENYNKTGKIYDNDEYHKITDYVSDKYLPYSKNIYKYNHKTPEDINNEYIIISIYKNLLARQPDRNELAKNLNLFRTGELDDETLKIQILNSPEYMRNTKMQSNEIEPGLESAIAREDLLSKLSMMYNNELNEIAPKSMLLPLRDIYIHLQYNDYLFRAMLINNNYYKFEREVLDTPLLSQEKLLKLFDKYFILSELKSIANDIRKKQLLEMKNDLGKIPEPLINKGRELHEHDTDIENILNKIKKQADKVFDKDDVAKVLKDGNYKSDHFIRVYDPIKYAQQYRGDPLFRPPVCTTLGQKQLVQPVFENSKTLFQGTDIKEAAENTQVGSIMPKFEYKEYQDINII